MGGVSVIPDTSCLYYQLVRGRIINLKDDVLLIGEEERTES